MPNNNDITFLSEDDLNNMISDFDSGVVTSTMQNVFGGYINTINPSTTTSTVMTQISLNNSDLTEDYITGELINKSNSVKIYTKLLPDLSDVDISSPVVYTRHPNKVLKIGLPNNNIIG